jgi:hypothetical protein
MTYINMEKRRGEKIGWICGWLGGFIWLVILSIISLFEYKWLEGCSGLVLTCIAVASILCFVPWRHPSVPYWKLMLIPYALFLASAVWAVWSFGGLMEIGLNGWNVFLFLPILLPFGILSRRTWADSSDIQESTTDIEPHH